MLLYYPVPMFAAGLCGLAYALDSGDEAVALRLPALTAQVQVTLAGSVHHEEAAQGGSHDPAFAVLGPTSAATNVVLAARTRVIGLGLLPAGWVRTVRASAVELADAMVAGDAIWGTIPCAALIDEMQGAGRREEAVAALFRFVASRAAGRQTVAEGRIACTTDWLGRAGAVDVGLLAQTLDLSLRQTERFTGEVFGARPKLLELKYRALRLAAVSALTGTRVYDVQRDDLIDSFYDQSHLIRTFSRFVGHAPSAFDRRADFARSMLHGRWGGGARTPLMLWS